MLSKQAFIDAINAIQWHSEIMDELMVPLHKLGASPVNIDMEGIHRKALVDVLKEATGDNNDWISWWLNEDVDKIVEWEDCGQKVQADLTEVETLYDFLAANIKNATSAALPLTSLPNDCFGKPRYAIEMKEFLLYFDACIKHINATGSTLFICEDGEEKYVLMSTQRYTDLHDECYEDHGDFFCPNCTEKLRVMYTAVNKEKGGTDFIGHCEHCHRSWEWYIDTDGQLHDILQYFFG